MLCVVLQGAPTATEGATEPIKEFISTQVADTPYKVGNPIPLLVRQKGWVVWGGNADDALLLLFADIHWGITPIHVL